MSEHDNNCRSRFRNPYGNPYLCNCGAAQPTADTIAKPSVPLASNQQFFSAKVVCANCGRSAYEHVGGGQACPPAERQYEQGYTVAELASLLRTKDRHIERLESSSRELRFWSGKSPAETSTERRVGDTVSIIPIIGCPHVPTDGWVITRIDTDVSYALRHNVGGSIHVEAARLAVKSTAEGQS